MQLKLRSSSPWLVAGMLLACSGVTLAIDAHRSVVTRTTPHYPELARRMHVTGIVILRVTIQPNGVVSDTQIESGHPLLSSAAQDAVRHWRFSPAPEASESRIEVSFSPDGN